MHNAVDESASVTPIELAPLIGADNDDDELPITPTTPRSAPLLGLSCHGCGKDLGHGLFCVHCGEPFRQDVPNVDAVLSKFIAPVICLGQAAQAAEGLPRLMGYSEGTLNRYIQACGGEIAAIRHEIATFGNPEDRANLEGLLNGTYKNPPHDNGDPPTEEELAAQRKTIAELLRCPESKTAHLEAHHILAVRLYTTSTYRAINAPLRGDPPITPNPFAATTYFISAGIKLLRSVAGHGPDAHTPVALWRGYHDMKITDAFMTSGGTEFGCMSTTPNEQVAIDFATDGSECPLLFKLMTKDFMSRGANVGFLSVYPGERENLFPPLTYLRPIRAAREEHGGKVYLVILVEPVIP